MRLTMPDPALRQPRNPYCRNWCCCNRYCGYWCANDIRSARGPDANDTTQPTPRTEHANDTEPAYDRREPAMGGR